MSEILNIVRNHRKTFYDFASGAPRRLWVSDCVKITFSVFLALMFSKVESGLLNAVLTIYSILIGFSFNVLFYLLSFGEKKSNSSSPSLERVLKSERLSKLSDELFYNVSYFNVVSISLVILALIWFLSFLPDPSIASLLKSTSFLDPKVQKAFLDHVPISTVFGFLVRSLFYCLLLETMHCFVRTVGRVSFYFSLKIRLQKEDQNEGVG